MIATPNFLQYKTDTQQMVMDMDIDKLKEYYVSIMRSYSSDVFEWFHWIISELYDIDRKKIGLAIVNTPNGHMELRTIARSRYDYYMLMSKRKILSTQNRPPQMSYSTIYGYSKTYRVV